MSITNFMHKIKGNTAIDKITILYLCIIVGVGISSFGLGRFSAIQNEVKDDDIRRGGQGEMINNQNQIEGIKEESSLSEPIVSKEKRYVASKNGKMYYSLGCSGANRIKKENEVWFGSKEDAEKSGYASSTSCK